MDWCAIGGWVLGFAAIGFLSVLITTLIAIFCLAVTLAEWIKDVYENSKRLDGPYSD